MTARETGNSIAYGDRSTAISGVGIVVNVYGLPSARSEYWRQLDGIAPTELLDREEELAELAAFCAGPDGPGLAYRWWRAPAWAGKSALMAWFALHPPDGLRIVPFFVTSRWGGYNVWTDFTGVVLEQLAEILGEPRPSANRVTEFRGFLDRAAQACEEAGQRLVLLVDGLDEDQGVTVGRDAHSIAALLPTRPVAGMRVIVSGRLNPPIPLDVSADHPLRDPAVMRELVPSPVAQVIREDMQRELDGLREGGRAERDILGLAAAARGGLSATDLAELIAADVGDAQEWPAARVSRFLATAAGRSFTPRPSRWQPDTGPDVYVLGHDDLQADAEDYLGGEGLDRYRDRLHAWADGYRDRGWPAGTPEYLLQGYSRILQSTGDLRRLVELAADTRRHSRILQDAGGDSSALAEIAIAQQALMTADPPDITAVARLAVHRQSLARRADGLPWGLPAAWVRIGVELGRERHVIRATEIARSFSDPVRRCAELLEAADALAASAGGGRAAAFTADALIAAREVVEPAPRAHALARVAKMHARLGALDQASERVTEALAAAADVGDVGLRESVLGKVAGAAASAGQADTAMRLARSVTDGMPCTEALQRAARSAARVGDLSSANAFLRAISIPKQRAWALGAVISVLPGTELAPDKSRAAVRSFADRAEATAKNIPELVWRADMLGAVAYALARVGETSRARHFARLARVTIRRVPSSENAEPKVPVSVACALVVLGDVNDALDIVRASGSASDRATLAEVLARAGQPDQAEALADEIEEPAPAQLAREIARGPLPDLARRIGRSEVPPRLNALALLARVAADAGDTDRAIRLCERLEFSPASATVRLMDDTTSSALAEALAAAGHLEEALALAETIRDLEMRMHALLGVAGAAAYDAHADALTAVRSWIVDNLVAAGLVTVAERAALSGDTARAAALAEEAVGITRRMDPSPGQLGQFPILQAAARVLAVIGEPERACSIAALLTCTSSFRDSALFEAAEAAAAAGRLDAAERIALTLDHPGDRAETLARIAEAAVHAGQPDRARALARASAAEPIGAARPAAATSAQSGTDFAFTAFSEVFDGPDSRIQARAAADSILHAQAQKVATGYLAGTGFNPAANVIQVATQPDTGFTAQSFTIPAMTEDPRTEVSARITQVFAEIGDRAEARATADATLAAARAIYSPRYKANALCHAAQAMAACGEMSLALATADEAMTTAKDIGGSRKQEAAERAVMRTRGLIARVAARNGDMQAARAITGAIPEDDLRSEALTRIAQDLARAGNEAGAVDLAWSIGDPSKQARALAAIAMAVTDERAQVLVGQALQAGDWEPCLTSLSAIAPEAVAAIAAEAHLLNPPVSADQDDDALNLAGNWTPPPAGDLAGTVETIEHAIGTAQALPDFGLEENTLPGPTAALLRRASELVKAGRLPEAAEAAKDAAVQCGELTDLDDAHVRARAASGAILGFALNSAGRPAEAVAQLTEALLVCRRRPVIAELAGTIVCLLQQAHLSASAEANSQGSASEDKLPRAQSLAILQVLAPALGTADAGQLAHALGDQLLGIFQAVGYLARTSLPISEYLNRLATCGTKMPDERHPLTYPRSLAAVTLLAMRELSRTDPAAAELIRMCAFFAPDPIPLNLLASAAALPGPLSIDGDTPIAWSQVADQVRRSSLGRIDQHGLILHRLAQAILRDQMTSAEAALARLRAEAVLLANEPGSTDAPVNWPAWALLGPHILAAERFTTGHVGLRDLARGMCWYLLKSGNIQAGYNLADELRTRWSRQLGNHASATLEVTAALTCALQLMRRHSEARPLDEEVLGVRRRTLGDDHPDTLNAANSLAIDLRRLGEVQAARELDEDTLARRKRVLGVDSHRTLISASNFALDLALTGELKAARKLNEDTLARRKHVLGRDHPDTLTSAFILADNLLALEKPKSARRHAEDALSRQRRVLGSDHPNSLASAVNLGAILHGLGDLQGARELDEDTLARQLGVFGDSHPDLFTVEHRLAETLDDLDDLPAARTLGQQTLDRRRRAFGDDHPRTLKAAASLAIVLRRAGEPQAARVLNEDTLARSRRIRGDDDDQTLDLANGLANDLSELGETEASRDLHEDTLARHRRLHGNDDPRTLISAHNLACQWHALGDFQTARDLHEDTLARRRRVLGMDDQHTLGTAFQLARDLRELGERQVARQLTENILTIERRTLGADHLGALNTAASLSEDLYDLGEFQRARELVEDLLPRLRRVLGDNDPNPLTAAALLAATLYELGELQGARELFEQTLIQMQATLGEKDPRTQEVTANLAETEQTIREKQQPPST